MKRENAELTVAIAILAAVFLLSLPFLGRVSIDASAIALAPDRAAREHAVDPIVMFLPTEDPFTAETIEQNRDLHRAVLETRYFASAQNLFTVHDVDFTDDVFSRIPVAGIESPDHLSVRRKLQRSPLLRIALLSHDENAWLHFFEAVPNFSSRELLNTVTALKHAFPELIVGGAPYWAAVIEKNMLRDVIVLFSCGLLLLALGFVIVLRSVAQAALLWFCALIGMVGTTAFFGALNHPLTVGTIPVPVLVLGLATSYSLHIRAGLFRGPWRVAIGSHGKIVAFTALTTIVGVGTLFLTHDRQLHVVAQVSTMGILLGAVVALASSPLMQRILEREQSPRLVQRPRFERKNCSAAKPRRTRLILGGIALTLLATGWLRVETRTHWADIFWPTSQAGRDVAHVLQEVPGFEEAVITFAHDQDFFWIDYERFQSLRRWGLEVQSGFPGTRVYGMPDIVMEIIGRWDNAETPVMPQNAEEIGEALELVRGDSILPFVFYDSAYRTTSMRIQIPDRERSHRTVSGIIAAAEQFKTNHPGMTVSFIGAAIDEAWRRERFLPEQLRGVIFFGVMIVSIVGFALRSFRRAFRTLLPPAVGIGTIVAVYGWLGWHLFPLEAVIFAFVAGVGVDDAILMSFFHDDSVSRRTVVATTIILSVAISAILLSSFFIVFRIGLMIILGLLISTTTVLLVFGRGENAPHSTEAPIKIG